MKNNLFNRLLTLLLTGIIIICSFAVPAAAVPTGKTEQELLEQLLDANFFSYYFNTEQQITLSEPINIYYTTENFDKLPFSYYAGKSLSAFNLQKGGHLYFVKEAGETVGFIGVRETDDGWQLIENTNGYTYTDTIDRICIGLADEPLISQYDAFHKYLDSIGKGGTEIAYLWMWHSLECLFTPELYNGYAINVGKYFLEEKGDTIYRTRDMALSVWNYSKIEGFPDGYLYGSKWTSQYPLEKHPVPQLLPEQHYSVTGFWCMMIGIPSIIIVTAIFLIRFIRRKNNFLLYFILFLALFSGCKSTSDVLNFSTLADDVLEIKLLSEDMSLLTVGQMTPEAEELILTELVLNGNSDAVDGGYRYIVSETLPHLQQAYTAYRDTAATQGILLYHGFAYLVVREEQTQLLIPISRDTNTDECISASEFIESVRAYQKSHSDTLSGGNGLG